MMLALRTSASIQSDFSLFYFFFLCLISSFSMNCRRVQPDMRVHHSFLRTVRTALPIRIWSVIVIATAATIPTIRLIAAMTRSTLATAVTTHLVIVIVIVAVIGKNS